MEQMQMNMPDMYDAALYLRLSKDDMEEGGAKSESNSIANQRELLRSFVKSQPDIQIFDIYVDDGYSGGNFDRPEFKRMTTDIEAGKVNCVIVKDLSRFGREYIEAGRWIEKTYPALNVRFISVTDQFDSKTADFSEKSFVVPIKNFVNESYCREQYPNEAEQIFREAERYYLEFMKDMPDLGENIMAKNMLDWFTILSFYEASGHRLDGEALLKIKRQMTDKMKFLGKFIDGNRQRWPYRLFERTYIKFIRMQKEHQAKGEWMDSWRVEINPEQHTEGFAFHLVGCPIVKHAKEHGYDKLLPYLCKTDHYLAEVMHARLIRTQTKALGGSYCDYWYVGDKSPVLEQYKDLEQI